jgi:endogenous inhibitor of DNA gyrase (YacG/DUF329 family)
MSCPICAKDTDAKYRPFCSRRCADVDLGKWLTGSYAIPDQGGPEEEREDDSADTPPNPSGPRPQ